MEIGVGGCQTGSPSSSVAFEILISSMISNAGDKALPHEATNAMEVLLGSLRSQTLVTSASSLPSPSDPAFSAHLPAGLAYFEGMNRIMEPWIGGPVSLPWLDLNKNLAGLLGLNLWPM